MSKLVHVVALAALLLTTTSDAGVTLRVPKDHSTVQAALDAAQTGDTVLLAKGVHEGPATLTGKTGITIRGLGAKSVLQADGNGPVLNVVDCFDVTVMKLRVRGDIWRGIEIDNSDGSLVKKCRVEVNGPTTTAIIVEDSVDAVIVDCVVRGAPGAGITLSFSSDCQVLDNDVRGVQGIGFGVGGARNSVLGNVASNCSSGVHASGSGEDNLIADNVFKKMTGRGVSVQSNPTTRILGNRIRKAGIYGIYTKTDGGLVHGNTVKKAGEIGIYVFSTGNQTISNNTVRSTGGDGITCASSNNSFLANDVRGSAQNGFLLSFGSGILLVANAAKKSGVADLDASGASNVTMVENTFGTIAP